MFALDTTIDTIQNGKKQFVNTFVTNKEIAKSLNNFVDAQSEYTKQAVKAGQIAATTITYEITKLAQEAMKFDWDKFSFKK